MDVSYNSVVANVLNVAGLLQANEIQTVLPLNISSLSVNSVDVTDALASKAPIANPTFTGNVSASSMTINGNAVATTDFVSAQISAVIGTAGAALDTLGEIANALGNNTSLSTTLTNSIALKSNISNPYFSGDVNVATGKVTAPGGYSMDLSQNYGMFMTGLSPNRRIYIQNTLNAAKGTAGLYLGETGTWTSASDSRLKYNIQPLDSCLNKILSLNPVTYTWKSTDKPSRGLIAQEVYEVIPEVVDKPENVDEMMGIQYTELIPFLIKSIQEQQVMINMLMSKN